MGKAELARKAGVSPQTIGRIEQGNPCRMETQRKIILALGYKLSDKDQVFLNTDSGWIPQSYHKRLEPLDIWFSILNLNPLF